MIQNGAKGCGAILAAVRLRNQNTHVLNLFQEIEGILPGDKGRMVSVIQEFLALSPEDQMIFCIGRRTLRMGQLSDLRNPQLYDSAQQVCREFGATPENFDNVVETIVKQYI